MPTVPHLDPAQVLIGASERCQQTQSSPLLTSVTDRTETTQPVRKRSRCGRPDLPMRSKSLESESLSGPRGIDGARLDGIEEGAMRLKGTASFDRNEWMTPCRGGSMRRKHCGWH